MKKLHEMWGETVEGITPGREETEKKEEKAQLQPQEP